MIPRRFGRMLMGKASEERQPRRPPPRWVPAPGITPETKAAHHISEGGFEVLDPTPPSAPAVAIDPIDDAGAIALADEIRRLSGAS